MTIFSNPIRQMYTSVVALWAITAIHHAYEAARYPSLHHSSGLLGIGEFTILLLLTLFLLEGYERTGSLRVYQIFSAVVFLGWVIIVGVYLSADHYVLRNLLFFTHAVPLSTLRNLWSGEQVPPNDLFHEGTGCLIFFFAIWVAIAWLQLERARRHTVATERHVQEADALVEKASKSE
jgi:CDP-diglyceride synthetase